MNMKEYQEHQWYKKRGLPELVGTTYYQNMTAMVTRRRWLESITNDLEFVTWARNNVPEHQLQQIYDYLAVKTDVKWWCDTKNTFKRVVNYIKDKYTNDPRFVFELAFTQLDK